MRRIIGFSHARFVVACVFACLLSDLARVLYNLYVGDMRSATMTTTTCRNVPNGARELLKEWTMCLFLWTLNLLRTAYKHIFTLYCCLFVDAVGQKRKQSQTNMCSINKSICGLHIYHRTTLFVCAVAFVSVLYTRDRAMNACATFFTRTYNCTFIHSRDRG